MPGLCGWLTRCNPAAVDLETGKTAQVEYPLAEDPPSAAGNKEKEKEGNKKEGNEREDKEKEEKEKEKAAYKSLLELLELAEDKSVTVGYMLRRVVEVGAVSGLTAALACTLALNWINRERQLGLRMWQFVTMAITIFAGLSIIRCITWLLLHALKSCSLWLHRDLSYFLREMKTSIDVTLWMCSVLFAWYVWFRPRLKRVHGKVSVVVAYQLTRFLIAVCLGSVLWVCKNALFYWLEADLHYRQLCDRITHTLCQLHVLQILVNSGVWQFLSIVQDGDDDPKKDEPQDMKNVSTITSTKKGANICKELLQIKRENVPVWILRRLCEEYMHHCEAKPLPGGTTKNEEHKHQFERKPLPVTTEVVQDPEKLRALALKLFREMKMAKKKSKDNVQESDDQRRSPDSDDDEVTLADLEGRYGVAPEHLQLFFEKLPKSDAYRTRFSKKNNPEKEPRNICGQNHCCSWVRPQKCSPNEENKSKKEDIIDQRIGRDDFCSWAVDAYRNCWGLQSTLKSSEQIIFKLNRMMMAFVLLLTLIIWLLLSEIVDTAQIALLFSPLLAAKFIFSESTKNMFDGLIFALAMHPFNPGDRVIINNMELLVTEINILTTTFHKYQTGEELIYPNSELATTPIINLEKIPDQHDAIEFPIEINTPLEYIMDLEVKIQMALDEREDAFKTKVVMKELGLDEIMMIAHFNYVGSYLTSEVKAVHKSEILSTIMRLQKEMKASIEKPPYFRLTKSYIVEI